MATARFRQTDFLNKRFRYKVKGVPYGEMVIGEYGLEFPGHAMDGVRELTVCEPLAPSKIPRFLLKHFVPNPGQPCDAREQIEAFWKGFDGRQSRSFDAFYFRDPVFRDFHIGAVFSENDVYLLVADPIYRSIFHTINHRFSGIAEESLEIDFEGRSVREFDHPEFGKCYEMKQEVDSKIYQGISLSGPEFCQVGQSDVSSGNFVTVKKFREINGLRYPELGEASDHVCKMEFELISVEDVKPPGANEAWFPEWPHGTSVNDQEQETVYQIPYTAEERKAILRNDMLKMKGFGTAPSGWSTFYIVNMVLLGVIVLGLGYKFYRHLRSA
jgi:hypothetical protein